MSPLSRVSPSPRFQFHYHRPTKLSPSLEPVTGPSDPVLCCQFVAQRSRWMESISHSPLCFLLRGPLAPSLTLLRALRASSSSLRSMAPLFPKNWLNVSSEPCRTSSGQSARSEETPSHPSLLNALRTASSLNMKWRTCQAKLGRLNLQTPSFSAHLGLPPSSPDTDCQLQHSISSLS